jgi:YHS domain-containing protein
LPPLAEEAVTGGNGQAPSPPRGIPPTKVPLSLGPRVVKLQARGEQFRIVQLLGNLFVCSAANGNCCCGRADKGRMPFDNQLYEQEWEARNLRPRVHLTFSGCLGPCALGNNAMLQIMGRSLWFKDLNRRELVPALFDYIEAIIGAGRIVPPPSLLEEHLYERYLSTGPGEGDALVVPTFAADDGEFERLDPVCLMDVDPATARHWVDYEGRRVYFCAPSCKRAFLKDPVAYSLS